MNEESLGRANRLLASVAQKVGVGDVFSAAPAELGRSAGIDDPLAVARAMRALLSRGRLESADGGYRLRDSSPVRADEKGTTPPRPRPERSRREAAAGGGSAPATYSEVGREAIDRLIDLGKEVATLRAEARAAREEVRTARAARLEAEQRAESFATRVHELEGRAEMAETNLRTLLASARGSGKDAPVATGEMEAILGVLKGETENAS